MEFQIGDKLKCTRDYQGYKAGTLYEVVSSEFSGTPVIANPQFDSGFWCFADHYLVTPNFVRIEDNLDLPDWF